MNEVAITVNVVVEAVGKLLQDLPPKQRRRAYAALAARMSELADAEPERSHP